MKGRLEANATSEYAPHCVHVRVVAVVMLLGPPACSCPTTCLTSTLASRLRGCSRPPWPPCTRHHTNVTLCALHHAGDVRMHGCCDVAAPRVLIVVCCLLSHLQRRLRQHVSYLAHALYHTLLWLSSPTLAPLKSTCLWGYAVSAQSSVAGWLPTVVVVLLLCGGVAAAPAAASGVLSNARGCRKHQCRTGHAASEEGVRLVALSQRRPQTAGDCGLM